MRAGAGWKIICNDEEIYLTMFKQITVLTEKENKQNTRNNQSYLYNLFLYTPKPEMPCAARKSKTFILNNQNYFRNYFSSETLITYLVRGYAFLSVAMVQGFRCIPPLQ
jgi:ribonucleotide reductase beta subunit family protein with ferritin-like domain